ncbi:sensor histidine kinase [Phaeobacter marinintestinus]|uniref:sensor histidine kinase n=1 Tax=Falsiphaeobacter marinintestinus TaxID=1492905 RepID=UPI0011B7193E|nr:ATP-binding protein [Phaeobacter marinintestinus]
MNLSRRNIILAFLLAVSLLATGVWRYGYLQALDQLAQRAEADLALASDRLSTQLQVYQELAVLTADHPGLTELSYPMRRMAAQALLLEIADKTGALDVAFVAPDGNILAAARGEIGSNLSAEPYFQRAMQGALGAGHGLVGPQERRAYFYAAPAFSVDGRVRGAVIMVADVEDVEQTWRGSTPAVFFMDARGEVFISNRSEILFWSRPAGAVGLEVPDGPRLAFRSSRVGGHEIWDLNWGPYLPRRALHMVRDLPVIGMTGEVLLDVAPARRLAGLQAAAMAAICLAFGAMLFMATERRRALAQANAVLESRVEARTQALSATNTQLRREVAEREEAEAALKQAQADLVQAGKLSALGQMSAGISHELNQPLMAIRQFADNGMAFLERDQTDKARENLGRIAELAARAARIIKNLRAFARNESEPMSKVDLVQVINTAVELTGVRLRGEGVALDWAPPSAPVMAWGGEVRLVQVFVNLINNAADAMTGQAEKRIEIRVHTEDRLTVTVRDIGPGIAYPEKIFEPFYSTKPVGSSEGMGLGLSISYGLVQSFGGNIRGVDTGGNGALFTVELEYFQREEAA